MQWIEMEAAAMMKRLTSWLLRKNVNGKENSGFFCS